MSDFSSSRLTGGLLTSAVRCHAVCAFVSLALIGASAWVWINAQAFSRTSQFSGQQIEEALTLIAEKDSLDEQYKLSTQLAKENKSRVEKIQSWLPMQVNWPVAKKQIKQFAVESGLELILVEKEKVHNGRRIAVVSVNCIGHGTYAQICQFLDRINKAEQPIWCAELRLQRKVMNEGGPVRCESRFSLRLPFAGTGTVAGKLNSMGVNRAG